MMTITERLELQEMDTKRRLILAYAVLTALMLGGIVEVADAQHTDEMWGERVMKSRRPMPNDEGNYLIGVSGWEDT